MPNINVVNPGLVNVADEAYPPPLPTRAKLPRNLGNLVDVSAVAPPIVPPGLSDLPLLVPVDVGAQAFTFPQGFGTPVPAFTEIIPQDVTAPDEVTDFVVTQAGSFPTDAAGEGTFFLTTIAAIVDADTGGAVGVGTVRYKISLTASLVPFGISFIGRQLEVTVATDPAPPLPPTVGQTRFIDFWSVNVIYIQKTQGGQTFNVDLQVGDELTFDVQRQGFEAVSQQTGILISTFLQTELKPLPVQEVPFTEGDFDGNFLASSGVAVPFVGSGTAAPSFQGTTEVEDQTFGRGLPANVFV